MRKKLFLILFVSSLIFSQTLYSQNTPKLMLRVDDLGMCHSVNLALKQLAETRIPFSASVMFACPWYQEAVDILKEHPQISVGIHLTLNSEWKYYRWGPVAGKKAVPSLADENGYFFPSEKEFAENQIKIEEVEIELRAQIERALRSGVRIDYVDHHMGTAVSTPELRALVEKLAKEYNLGITLYFGEIYNTLFPVSIEKKAEHLFGLLDNLHPEKTNVVVIHIGLENPELNALVDMNNPIMNTSEGAPLMSKHRNTELNVLRSEEFKKRIEKNKIRLVTYHDLISQYGLESMKRPE